MHMRYLIFGVAIILCFSFGFSVWFLGRITDLSVYNDTPIRLYKQYKKVTVDPNCPVKVSTSGVYHLAGDQWYERLKPAVCFNTETEAVDNGYKTVGK